jgi:hypothetical protein
MTKRIFPAFAAIGLLALGAALQAQDKPEPIDYPTLAAIRDEALQHSEAMDDVSWLSDVYGPRLTGSPGFRQAAAWAQKKFAEWGLVNIHTEPFSFGKSWSLVRFNAHMIEPQISPLIGFPKSWTPGTKGTVQADVIRVQINSDTDFEKYRGKLGEKIVLTQPARDVKMLDGTIFRGGIAT